MSTMYCNRCGSRCAKCFAYCPSPPPKPPIDAEKIADLTYQRDEASRQADKDRYARDQAIGERDKALIAEQSAVEARQALYTRNAQLSEQTDAQARTITTQDKDVRELFDRLAEAERAAADYRTVRTSDRATIERLSEDNRLLRDSHTVAARDAGDWHGKYEDERRMTAAVRSDGNRFKAQRDEARQSALTTYKAGRQAARKDIVDELVQIGYTRVNSSTRSAVDRAVPPEEKKAPYPRPLGHFPQCPIGVTGCPCVYPGATIHHRLKPTPRPPQPHPAGEAWCPVKNYSVRCPYCHPND